MPATGTVKRTTTANHSSKSMTTKTIVPKTTAQRSSARLEKQRHEFAMLMRSIKSMMQETA